jgi:hypothetical protein
MSEKKQTLGRKLIVAAVIASWFLCNGGLLITNKYLMSTGFKNKR